MSRKSGKSSNGPKLEYPNLNLNLSPPSTEEYNYNYNNYNDSYNCNYNYNNYNNNNCANYNNYTGPSNYNNYNGSSSYNNCNGSNNYNNCNGSRRSPTESSFSSSSGSCLSSENEHETTSMVLAGCPRCFMYVLLSEDDPSCPKCKSPVLIDLLGRTDTGTGSKKKNRKS